MGFRSASELLAWAYEINSIDEGAQSSLRAAAKRSGVNPLEGLDKIEVKGWAAQVVCWVPTLPPDECCLALGRFGAKEHRSAVVFALVGRVSTRYGIAAASLAIERWFESDGTITKSHLAIKMHKSERTAATYFNEVATILEEVNARLLDRVRRRFGDMIDGLQIDRPTHSLQVGVDRKNCTVVI